MEGLEPEGSENRLVATAITAAVSVHLTLLLAQSSIVGDILVPSFLAQGNWLHLALLAVPVVSVTVFRLWRETPRVWQLSASLAGLYGILVIASSAHAAHGFTEWSQIILVPMTILSLSVCAPLAMPHRRYRTVFWILAALLTAHSLLTFCFLARGSHYFLGRDITSGAGRAKELFGLGIHHTDGLYSNANAIGSFLMFLPAVLIGMLAAPVAAPVLVALLVCLVSTAAALALTFSRGALLTAAVGLLFPAIGLRKRSRRQSIAAVAAIGLLSLFLISPLIHNVADSPLANSEDTHRSALLEQPQPEASSGRLEIWSALGTVAAKHPLFGAGLMQESFKGQSPHNFLLANVLYFGAAGTLALLALLSTLASVAWKRLGAAPMQMLPIAGILVAAALVHGQVEYVITHPLYFSNSMFWLLLGYLCFSSDLEIKPEEKRQEGSEQKQQPNNEPAPAT